MSKMRQGIVVSNPEVTEAIKASGGKCNPIKTSYAMKRNLHWACIPYKNKESEGAGVSILTLPGDIRIREEDGVPFPVLSLVPKATAKGMLYAFHGKPQTLMLDLANKLATGGKILLGKMLQ